MPHSLAKSTANELGADTAAIAGILAMKHLAMISYEIRPLTRIIAGAFSE